jgi:hypothetical protein
MISRRYFLLASAALPLGQGKAAPDRGVLKFVFSRPYANPRTQWLIRVYTDICTAMGYRFEFLDVPPRRATALVLAGHADGELGRTYAFQSLFPGLHRVEEPNNTVTFAAYVSSAIAVPPALDDLRAQGRRYECRRGIWELEFFLRQRTAPGQVSHCGEVWQGLQKLVLGRTDLYFDVREAVRDCLDFPQCNEARIDPGAIRELATVMTTTGHCYLGPHRAALAPDFAAGLLALKKSGASARHLDACLNEYRTQHGRPGPGPASSPCYPPH